MNEKMEKKSWNNPIIVVPVVIALVVVAFFVLRPKPVTPESVFSAMVDSEEVSVDSESIVEINSISTEFGENRVNGLGTFAD